MLRLDDNVKCFRLYCNVIVENGDSLNATTVFYNNVWPSCSGNKEHIYSNILILLWYMWYSRVK